MRQGGYRPHNHNSGVYWTRVHGINEGKKMDLKKQKPGDLNGDGVVDGWDTVTAVGNAIITIIGVIVFIVLLVIGITYSPT